MKWAEHLKKKAMIKRMMEEEEKQINAEIRSENGLYLISNVCYNPISKNTNYIIKIGIASDISKRMTQYKSTNPMLNHIDFLYGCSKEQGRNLENLYHNLMRQLSYKQIEGTQEWFEIEESVYFNILNKGFHYFISNDLKLEATNRSVVDLIEILQMCQKIYF